MFKRGDVYEYDDKSDTFIFDGKDLVSISGGDIEPDVSGIVPYTGPTYEKDGQRFVPSGEYRRPKGGEWYMPESLPNNTPFRNSHGHPGYRVILLPVPELEHEFKVGDWVKDGNGLHIATVSVVEAGGYMLTWSLNNTRSFYTLQFAKEHLTKLPGRPLTTDDLMQVLSGRKITVECHACECKGVIGQVSAQNAKWPNEKTLSMCFFHENQPFGEGEVHSEANPLAYFEDNKLVFADGVEGSIYVVSE